MDNLDRIEWTASSGFGGQLGPDYAHTAELPVEEAVDYRSVMRTVLFWSHGSLKELFTNPEWIRIGLLALLPKRTSISSGEMKMFAGVSMNFLKRTRAPQCS